MAGIDLTDLRVEYASEAAFQDEYVSNISQGGIFVASKLPLEVRDPVRVLLELGYCGERVRLRGEVVSRIPVELANSGAKPGVAVQFAQSVAELRAKLEPFVGQTPPEPEPEPETGRRVAPRAVARVRAHIDDGEGGGFAANTRDISTSGVLISSERDAPAVGQSVKLALVHPLNGKEMRVEGSVVRHVTADSGAVEALGIQFHVSELDEEDVGRFVEEIKATEHSRRLGAVSGTLGELGVHALIEMFGGSAPQGTLILSRGTDAGLVILSEGMFVDAQAAGVRGLRALAELLRWQTGSFEFQGYVDEELATDAPLPLARALREAEGLIPTLRRALPGAAAEICFAARLEVDVSALDAAASPLSKTEDAVIDLAIVGMTVAKVVEIIPEPESEILTAIANLADEGLVRLLD